MRRRATAATTPCRRTTDRRRGAPTAPRPHGCSRTSAAARVAHLVGGQQLAGREDRTPRRCRGSSAGRRPRTRRGGRPRRPRGRCAPGGRRSTGTRRRSSRARRPRRAPRPGTRAGSPSSTSRVDQLVAVELRARARATIGSTSSTCGPRRCTSARTGATTHRRAASPPRAAATSPAGGGPSSRATATPARTAASPRPGTARPRRPARNWARSCTRRSASVRGRHRDARSGAACVTWASAGDEQRPGGVGHRRPSGSRADDGAQRRLLGEERGEGGEGRGRGIGVRARATRDASAPGVVRHRRPRSPPFWRRLEPLR